MLKYKLEINANNLNIWVLLLVLKILFLPGYIFCNTIWAGTVHNLSFHIFHQRSHTTKIRLQQSMKEFNVFIVHYIVDNIEKYSTWINTNIIHRMLVRNNCTVSNIYIYVKSKKHLKIQFNVASNKKHFCLISTIKIVATQ